MIRLRKATYNDREALLKLIDEGFSAQGNDFSITEGEEHRVLFSYLYTRPTWNPEWLYVAEQDGKLLAAAGYFPQTLLFEEIAIPVGAISPVVTDPKYRGQGLARKCLNKMLENLRVQGVPLVFLWGLPFYYPQLGFVPILPRYQTKITLKELKKITSGVSGRFRECGLRDLKIINELYHHEHYWIQPTRSLEWWQERFAEIDTESAYIKEVPFPKRENFLIWENTSGEVAGYINYSSEYFNYTVRPGDQKIIISEAVSIDLDSTLAMLKVFSTFMKPSQTLYIRGTPEHSFNAAAYQLGGMHLNPAPLAGMVKVIDWPLFINLLTPLFHKRLTNLNPLHKENHCCWTVDNSLIQFTSKSNSLKTNVAEMEAPASINDNQLLTRLIFGLYNRFDLEMTDKALIEFLTVLFPRKYPFIWDANYLY
jgi:predicted acetyltransferase